MALGKYYADNEKNNWLHQLKKLQPRNIVYEFYFSQTGRDLLQIRLDNT
jgi:hypothetical protein